MITASLAHCRLILSSFLYQPHNIFRNNVGTSVCVCMRERAHEHNADGFYTAKIFNQVLRFLRVQF